MAHRNKRSISLPPDLDAAIEDAAVQSGTTVSGWLAETAQRRLRIEAGLDGVAAWEAEHGRLTEDELAEGRARARVSLGRSASVPPST